jgi:hypothetical protein
MMRREFIARYGCPIRFLSLSQRISAGQRQPPFLHQKTESNGASIQDLFWEMGGGPNAWTNPLKPEQTVLKLVVFLEKTDLLFQGLVVPMFPVGQVAEEVLQ